MSNILYYAFCLVALVVGFFIVKKVASCLVRLVVAAVIVLAIAALIAYLNGILWT